MLPSETSLPLGLSEDSSSDEDDQSLEEDDRPLDEDELYTLLGNERRRICLKLLADVEGKQPVKELSEEIARQIADDDTDADDLYDSVYISLCQTHLPKLDDLGLVDYDSDEQTITVDSRYEEVEPRLFADSQTESRAHVIRPELVGASVVTLVYLALVLLGSGTVTSLFLPVVFAMHFVIVGIGIWTRLD